MQAAGELPNLLEAGGERFDSALQERSVVVGDRAHSSEAQQRRRQPLLRAVVEVALDPPALGIGDGDERGGLTAT